MALQYLKPSNRTVGLFVPGTPDRAEIPRDAGVAAMLKATRATQPASEGEAFDASPANIDERARRASTLPGGMKLALLPKETRGDAVNASIRLNFGDERSLAGNARVAARHSRDADARHREQDAPATPGRARQAQSAAQRRRRRRPGRRQLVSTRTNLAAVLELAIEVLRKPSFPESELETLRAGALADLDSAQSDPQAIVSRAFGRHGNPYGPTDIRYVPTIEEERASLTSATVKNLRDFHAAFYGASNAEVAVVGDFDPEEIRKLIATELDELEEPETLRRGAHAVPRSACSTREPSVRHAGQGERDLRRGPANRNERCARGLSGARAR